MTKSLGSLLSRAEGRLAPLLRLHVHASTQQMAQGDLVPVLHRADKKKRGIVKNLLQVREEFQGSRGYLFLRGVRTEGPRTLQCSKKPSAADEAISTRSE